MPIPGLDFNLTFSEQFWKASPSGLFNEIVVDPKVGKNLHYRDDIQDKNIQQTLMKKVS